MKKLKLALLAPFASLALALLSALPASATTTTIASWQMNEPAGATKMADSSGHGLTGTILTGVKTGLPGHSGQAYGFTGNGGYVSVPNSPLLSSGTGAFSVAVSFKSSTLPSASVGDYDLIRKGLGSTAGGDWKIEIEANGHAFCHLRGTTNNVNLGGSTNVVNGAWHRLECRTRTTGTALVVDGVLQAWTSLRPGNISNTASVIIGAKDAVYDRTTGLLDEVVITKG